jgi:hypothetical protein
MYIIYVHTCTTKTRIPSTFSSFSSNKSILPFSLWVSRLILRKTQHSNTPANNNNSRR